MLEINYEMLFCLTFSPIYVFSVQAVQNKTLPVGKKLREGVKTKKKPTTPEDP